MTTDGLPPDYGGEMRRLEERIRALELNSRLRASSVRGGRIDLLNSDGTALGYFGQLEATEDGALVVYAPGASVGSGGEHMLVSGEGGVERPWLHYGSVPLNNPFTLSAVSGTFASVHQWHIRDMTGPECNFLVLVQCLNGGTAELKLVGVGPVGSATQKGDVKSVSGTAFHHFTIAHGIAVNAGRSTFTLQARMTGGTGPIEVYQPSDMAIGGGFPSIPAGGWH